MILCYINVNRIQDFDFDPKSLWGFEIGDYIEIPDTDYRVREYLYSNLVKITGFNPEQDIIHWEAMTKLGGLMHSGSHRSQCIKLD